MIRQLRSGNADYDRKIAFIYADWDVHARSPITKKLKVVRRSTLVMLSPKGELARVVAQTSESALKGLLDKAPERPAGAKACTS